MAKSKPGKRASGRRQGALIEVLNGGSLREGAHAYKKDLILRTACEAFYEHGYHDTTVDMVTEKLSGTKAIFYYYYPDKRAVLEEIFRRALSEAIAVGQHAISTSRSPQDALEKFARDYTLWLIDNQRMVDVFWREERTISKEVRAEIAIQQKRIDDMIAKVLKEGISAGQFDVHDVRTASRAIMGMITFVHTWWRPERRLSREEAGDYFAALALRLAGAKMAQAGS